MCVFVFGLQIVLFAMHECVYAADSPGSLGVRCDRRSRIRGISMRCRCRQARTRVYNCPITRLRPADWPRGLTSRARVCVMLITDANAKIYTIHSTHTHTHMRLSNAVRFLTASGIRVGAPRGGAFRAEESPHDSGGKYSLYARVWNCRQFKPPKTMCLGDRNARIVSPFRCTATRAVRSTSSAWRCRRKASSAS